MSIALILLGMAKMGHIHQILIGEMWNWSQVLHHENLIIFCLIAGIVLIAGMILGGIAGLIIGLVNGGKE